MGCGRVMICRGEVHGIIDDTHVIVGSYLYKWLPGKVRKW